MPCYEHLRRYQGAKKRCAHCGRKFGPGEVVSVEGGARERVFCYSDAGGGCVIVYNFRKGRRDKVIFGRLCAGGSACAKLPPGLCSRRWREGSPDS